ncbi:tape measure protein [Methyloversatilis discipulorum]|uniref:tape measure protein n=1 Tax=Methyloversatilis discipulorum TaxID=1119528 RepID=UPI0031379821
MDIATLGIRIDASQAASAAQSLDRFEKSAGAADAAVSKLRTAVGGLAAGFSVREVANAADTFATLNAQLRIATGSASAAAQAYGDVFRIARSSGQSLETIGTIYRRLATVSGDIGISQKQVAETTQAVANAMLVSGGSAASAQAALVQFSQGLASGTLRGEELNSVLEQAPRLAQALAEGLGIPQGQLRELASTGAITSRALVDALKSQSEVLQEEANQLPAVFSRAFTNLDNAFINTVGNFEKSTGVFRGTASAINGLANNFDVVAGAVGVVGTAYAGRFVAGVAAGTVAKIAAANQARRLAAAELESAAAALANVQATNAATLSTNGLAAAQARLAGAQAAVAAASRGAAALGFLAGPLGAITTALTLGATAWAIWGERSETAANTVEKEVKRSTAEIVADLDKQIEKLKRRNALRDGGLPELAEKDDEPSVRARELSATMEEIKNRTGQYSRITDSDQMALLRGFGLEYAKVLGSIRRLREEQQKAIKESNTETAAKWLEKYATDAEKLRTELLKARQELGASLSPDLVGRVVDKFSDREGLGQRSREARADAATLRAQGRDARDSLFDRAEDRRQRGLSEEDRSERAQRQASSLGARATLSAGDAFAALRDGDLKRAQRLAEDATKLAERAGRAAENIADDDTAARQLEELGRLREKIGNVQAGLKDAEADQIDQAKARIDGLITALTTPVSLNLDTAAAEKKINDLIAQLSAIGTQAAAATPAAPPAQSGGSVSMGGRTVTFDQNGQASTAQQPNNSISWTRDVQREAKRVGR